MKYLFLFALFCFPLVSHAAQLSIELPQEAVRPGDTFIAEIYIDTEREAVNAIEGAVLYPEALLEVQSVREGGSVVPVWLTRPRADEDSRMVFAGITPGGFNGEKGFLFSVVFKAKEEGSGTLILQDIQLLRNDGLGSYIKTTSVSPRFSVSSNAPSSVEKTPDVISPERFTVTYARTPDAFDGKGFLVFAAQDKQTGIQYYEVCEGFFSACARGESPYLLKHDYGNAVRVRAVDEAGNAAESWLFTPGAFIRYGGIILGTILLGAAAAFLRRFLHPR